MNEYKQALAFMKKLASNNENPYGSCPVCGQPGVERCRCRLGDTKCASGHEWHHYNDELHLGPSNHKDGADHKNCKIVQTASQELLEGDDVDKTIDASKRVQEHMNGAVSAVDDHDWLGALSEGKAVRDLAETFLAMVKVMRDSDRKEPTP